MAHKYRPPPHTLTLHKRRPRHTSASQRVPRVRCHTVSSSDATGQSSAMRRHGTSTTPTTRPHTSTSHQVLRALTASSRRLSAQAAGDLRLVACPPQSIAHPSHPRCPITQQAKRLPRHTGRPAHEPPLSAATLVDWRSISPGDLDAISTRSQQLMPTSTRAISQDASTSCACATGGASASAVASSPIPIASTSPVASGSPTTACARSLWFSVWFREAIHIPRR